MSSGIAEVEHESEVIESAARPFRLPIRRRYLVGAALLVIAAISVVALLSLSLAAQAPPWWRSVDAADPTTITLAEDVERGVFNALHRSRPGGEAWTVSISAAQANAWLNVKMPRWLENRRISMPKRVAEIQAEFESSVVALGVRLITDDGEHYVSATVTPTLGEDDSLWMVIAGAKAGRLDLPSGWTVSRLRDWLPPEVRERESTQVVLDALAGLAPLFPDASVRLEDGRRVRLVEIRPEGGKLYITCITEAPQRRGG